MRKFMGSVDLRQIYTPIGQMAIFVAGAGALCSVIMIILALLCRGSGADQVLQATHGGAISPDWALGAFLGAGGFAGSYLGARLQRRLPERTLRRLLGLIACLVAVRYVQTAVEQPPMARPAHATSH